MVIRTSERNFTVVQVLSTSPQEEASVCRDLEGGGTYLINRYPTSSGGHNLLPLLSGQMGNPAFEDYIRVFTQDGDVYAQFAYQNAPNLEDRLEGYPHNLQERLTIATKLLERLVLQDMPPQMACAVLQRGKVKVDDTLNCHFLYQFTAEELQESFVVGDVCSYLEVILYTLFEVELSALAAPLLEKYLKNLSKGHYESYLDIYASFAPVREALLALAEQGMVVPRTFLFRLWDRIMGFVKMIKPILIGLLLVAAFCYLIYTIVAPSTITGTPVFFDSIGTVEIVEVESEITE